MASRQINLRPEKPRDSVTPATKQVGTRDGDEDPEQTEKEESGESVATAETRKDEQEKEIEAETLHRELGERLEKKREERAKNLSAGDDPAPKGSDTSIKKNSAFVKKLKTATEQQRDSLTREAKSLNLTRYVDEAATNIGEAKYKVADVSCVVHICSLIHRSYVDFSSKLLAELEKVFASGLSKEEKPAHLTQYRTALRLIAELIVCGVFPDRKSTYTLVFRIMDMILNGDQNFVYLSVILSFARHCGEDMAGLVSRKQRQMLEKFGFPVPRSDLVSPERQATCFAMLQRYYNSLSDALVKEHRALQKMEHRKRKAMQTKGEISDEQQEALDKRQKSCDRLLSNATVLADVLDVDMPDLPEDDSLQQKDEDAIVVGIVVPKEGESFEDAAANALWGDEDTRTFYENLIDLKSIIPGILFKDGEGADADTAKETSKDDDTATSEAAVQDIDEEAEAQAMLEEMSTAEEDLPPLEDSEESVDDATAAAAAAAAESETTAASAAHALLNDWLTRLPTCINRDFIDQAATEFCTNLNTKASRKKLVKALFGVSRTRLDLLPFYARLVATLHPCLPEIGPELTEMLVKEMKHLVRRKGQMNLEVKVKNVRFIGELTKFRVCSKTESLNCLKILVKDFHHHSVDMTCHMLETCGRFLFRSPDSHVRMRVLLDIMMRKKIAMQFDSRYATMIENAYYDCNPPEVKKAVRKERPPLHEYVRKLLYKDLNKASVEKVLRQFRKLDWTDSDVANYAVKCLTRVWLLKFSNIHCLANMLSGLAEYQENVGYRVVDGVLEDIRWGLETNLGRYNQRRISAIKYLGELYNYRLIESSVIFRTLYTCLSFGHNSDGSPSHLDPPSSFFRVRLICALLDTCGQYFSRGIAKKRLDGYLTFLQCYLWGKEQPLPLDVEFLLHDTVESLRPRMTWFASNQEAQAAAYELEANFKASLEVIKPVVGDSTSVDGSMRTSEGDDDEEEDDEEEGGEDEAEEGNDAIEEDGGVGTDDEDTVHLRGERKHVPSAEDDAFLNAFEKMMADTVQSRRHEAVKAPTVDIGLPLNFKGPQILNPVEEESRVVNFSVMVKRGHKQLFKEIAVPEDSSLVLSVRNKQEVEQKEKREMKKFVLDYEQRQEQEAIRNLHVENAQKTSQQTSPPKVSQPKLQRPESGGSSRGGGGWRHGRGGRGRGSGRGGYRGGGGGGDGGNRPFQQQGQRQY
ncbi:regulator of nonsense transcripts 2-like isoform X2 [Oscarella lobularis]|uniref:regulator of nonsense transcripts 2-like isoform X2 n=1 Tax=Oscarella lobularis TaxID=121494 RepID=UPI0033140BFC